MSLKPPKHNKNLIFLWLIHMADIALWEKVCTKLRHFSQSYTNQLFLSSCFSCLPMKVCSLKYMLNILFSLETCIVYEFFGTILSNLVIIKSHQKLPKVITSHQLYMKSSYRMISSNLKICITSIKQNLSCVRYF